MNSESDGLLQTIGEQLAGNDNRFVFASGSDARELGELCEAARDSPSRTTEFERHFLKAATRTGTGSRSYAECLGMRCSDCSRHACGGPMSARSTSVNSRTRCTGARRRSFSRTRLHGRRGALRGIVEDSVAPHDFPPGAYRATLGRRGFPLRRLRNPGYAGVAVDKRRRIATWTSHGGSSFSKEPVSNAATETLLSRLDRNSE